MSWQKLFQARILHKYSLNSAIYCAKPQRTITLYKSSEFKRKDRPKRKSI